MLFVIEWYVFNSFFFHWFVLNRWNLSHLIPLSIGFPIPSLCFIQPNKEFVPPYGSELLGGETSLLVNHLLNLRWALLGGSDPTFFVLMLTCSAEFIPLHHRL